MRPNKLDEGNRPFPVERDHHTIITACYLEPDPLAVERLCFREVGNDIQGALPPSRPSNLMPVPQRGFCRGVLRPERDQLVSGDDPHTD